LSSGPNEVGHILDAVDDECYFIVRSQNGRVDGAPISFFKSSTLRFRLSNVVFLHGHGVGNFSGENSLKGRTQVANSGSRWIIQMVRKNLKDATAQNVLAPGHGGAKIRVSDGGDGKVRRQDQA